MQSVALLNGDYKPIANDYFVGLSFAMYKYTVKD